MKNLYFAVFINLVILYSTVISQEQDISMPITNNLATTIQLSPSIPSNLSSNWDFSVNIINTGFTTVYDWQANGSTKQLLQDASNPDRIHLVVMDSDLYPFSIRQSKYYVSNNRGLSWQYICSLLPELRNGFPTIAQFSDGRIIIALHTFGQGIINATTYCLIQETYGGNIFTQLDPGNFPTESIIHPRVVSTSSLSNNNKFVLIGSDNVANDVLGVMSKYCTSLIPPGIFSNWNLFQGTSGENYDIERGLDGRIGVVYSGRKDILNDYGCMYFRESYDDGTTFSIPYKFYQPIINPSGDSLAAAASSAIIYKDNSPKVVFETIKKGDGNSWWSDRPAEIKFWTNSFSGQVISLANKDNVPYNQNVNSMDFDGNLTLPVIGKSADNTALFCVFMVTSSHTGGNSEVISFYDIYLTMSIDNGNYWFTPLKINPEYPLRDWTFPSISPTNDNDVNNYYVNIGCLSDVTPGTYVRSQANGPSVAEYKYIRITIPRNILKISNNSNTNVSSYTLYQNYPNPFNPSTNIKFEIPKSSFVNLVVYDVLGREIAKLVNEKLNAGSYLIDWNASQYPSGMYFYKLTSGEFSEVKKMVLIK